MSGAAARRLDTPEVKTEPLRMVSCGRGPVASNVPLACATLSIDTSQGERTALVLTPTQAVVVERAPAQRGKLSAIDDWIIAAARKAAEQKLATVCIYRARADVGPGCYRFSGRLQEAEVADLAETMLGGQLLIYRELVRMGVCLFVHSEFGYAEAEAYRVATERHIAALRLQDDAQSELDLWILQNLVFFFTSSFESLATTVLPEKLPMMEKRMERIRRMAARLD